MCELCSCFKQSCNFFKKDLPDLCVSKYKSLVQTFFFPGDSSQATNARAENEF